MITLVVLHLIVLHMVDGREIYINPEQITSLREAHDAADPKAPFAKGVRCMINFTDSKFVTVTETCDVVQQMLEGR